MIRLLAGDCRVTLRTLEPESVQVCVTSPPYFGLRDYGLPPLVWGGIQRIPHTHEWGASIPGDNRGGSGTFNGRNGSGEGYGRDAARGAFCPCGAWSGSLGLEPTPELFIEHLVEVFREVRRVLHPTGTVWLNLGDSYAGSGNGSNDYRENGSSLSKDDRKYQGQRPAASLPAKNLMMMPFRVAMALQGEGWWLRSVIPWLKRNAMPESVTDRPATSLEYVFLLAKSARYFWNADAVKMGSSPNTHDRRKDGGVNPKTAEYDGSERVRPKNNESMVAAINGRVELRNRRNSDWFFESWQGLMLDEQDDPLALVVNPAGYAGAHFATWPLKLVEPMIKAGSRPGDTVLDPFAGSGTTLMVADRLGRNAVGCELNSDYVDLAIKRNVDDGPMFAQVAQS